MARQVLSTPSVTLTDLRVTKGAIEQRWVELGALFPTVFELDRTQLRVHPEDGGERIWAGLRGALCERVTRNRGGTAWVAPLCSLPADLSAWLSWQEVWDVVTGPRPFRFRNVGLTIYVGKTHDSIKPQVLRLEWPGIRDWSGAGLSFQSPGAGHPHWQIDFVKSLTDQKLAKTFEPAPSEIVEDFEILTHEPTAADLVRSLSIERMHLASAAPWWLPSKVGEHGRHMNAPENLAALTRWLRQSILYLRQELRRCSVAL